LGGVGGHPTGGNTGTGGRTNLDCGAITSCSDLKNKYNTALSAAKVCTPNGPSGECSDEIQSTIDCDCMTFVSKNHRDAIATMQALRTCWQTLGCGNTTSCPLTCVNPTLGSCTSSSGSAEGKCVDMSVNPG
jgi:hypothetical protein